MLKKSMLLSIQILMVLGLLLTGCQNDNSTEPVTVDDNPVNPVSLSKANDIPSTSPSRGGTLMNPSFDYPALPSGTQANQLPYWSATSTDCLVTSDDLSNPQSQCVVFVGWEHGGNYGPEVLVSNWVPVNPGRRYRLGGLIYKCAHEDHAYLDFNDGVGYGGNFQDAHAEAFSLFKWEQVSVEVTIPSNVTHIKVRCVRDGLNRYNALFDKLTFEEVN